MGSEFDKNYGLILQSLKEKIRHARVRASWTNNLQMLQIYWDIGKTIFTQEQSQGWGAKIIDRLAVDLKMEFENMKGLSPRNLRYMRDFAKAYLDFVILQSPLAKLETNQYPENVIVQQAAAQLQSADNQNVAIWKQSAAKLPWGHHQVILDRLKTFEERVFYIQHCVQQTWSRDILVHQIESNLYKRQGALTHNFKQTLPDYESELAQQLFKDPYQFDFLMLGRQPKNATLKTPSLTN
jgi:predicted nuclease of restriction endonuclease-like (RecB) superfamily